MADFALRWSNNYQLPAPLKDVKFEFYGTLGTKSFCNPLCDISRRKFVIANKDCIQVANDGSIAGKEIIGLVIFVVNLAIWVYYLIVSIKKLKQSGK
jgi:hypothetical protein